MKLESTPCSVVLVKPHGKSKDKTEYLFKAFWSQNRRINGYQIGYQIYKDHKMIESGTTGGYGYCKESHAFSKFVYNITKGKYRAGGGEASQNLWKYHKGGNYYECTMNQLKKAVKR